MLFCFHEITYIPTKTQFPFHRPLSLHTNLHDAPLLLVLFACSFSVRLPLSVTAPLSVSMSFHLVRLSMFLSRRSILRIAAGTGLNTCCHVGFSQQGCAHMRNARTMSRKAPLLLVLVASLVAIWTTFPASPTKTVNRSDDTVGGGHTATVKLMQIGERT